MPFSIVLTIEGSSQLISIVPSTWVDNDSILFWPRTRKTSDLELLRRDENSLPSQDWKKLKCKVKLHGIATFAEGIKLEEIYSNFDDTEDEERFHKNREIKRKHPVKSLMVEDLLNLNDDFVTTAYIENIDQATTSRQAAVASKVNHTEEIETDASEIKATHSHQNVTIPETEHEENLVTMSYKALNEILTENSALLIHMIYCLKDK